MIELIGVCILNSSVNKRLDEVQISRGIAIFGVLIVHGTSTAALNVPHDSLYFPLYNLLHTLGRLGTPTFIMLSSFILFYSYYKRDFSTSLIRSFFKKRLKYILVPYIVISLFYFYVKWRILGVISFESSNLAWGSFQYDLLFGKAHPHLYFVFLSVQFYLLFPFVLWAMKTSALLRKYAVLIGLTIQLFWLYVNTTYELIPTEFSIIFSYAALYFLGAYLGIHYEHIKMKIQEGNAKLTMMIVTVLFFCGFFSFAFVGYNYLVHLELWDYVAYYFPDALSDFYYRLFWLGYTFFVSMVVLLIANYINKYSNKVKGFLIEVGSLSFGIYLIHPFYLLILRPLFVTDPVGIFHIYQFIIFVLTFIFSVGTVYVAYRFIPFHWIIFGKSSIPYYFKEK